MNNIFAEICKVNPETRMVYGYASTEALDVQGERVSKEALANALPEYMRFANIREMHQPSAVGVAKEASIDAKGLYLAAKVVDDDAWNKVKEGVYKGFSIGGKSITKVEDTITAMRLSEISLVDRPANPEAVIEVWKADGTTANQVAAIDELAELLNNGTITPESLLAFAKGEGHASTINPSDEIPENNPQSVASEAEPVSSEPAATAEVELSDQTLDCGKVDLAKYAGEEVFDAHVALQALAAIQNLFSVESMETEEPAQAEQLSALQAVIDNLKAFIASEIQEDNQPTETQAVNMAEPTGNVAKVGKALSAKNMAKIQDLHDTCCAMGAKCDKSDGIAQADAITDLAKSSEAVSKITDLETTLQKLGADNLLLKGEIERLKRLPQHGKAFLRAISKADDVLHDADVASKPVEVISGSGKVNEAASLIKMIHQQGGVI